MRARGTRAAAVSAVSGLLAATLTGCGDANAGSSAAQRVKEYFAATYGRRVVEVVTHHDNTLPFTGSLRATVRLHPSTPDDVLAAVERDLVGWDAGSGVTFTPVGVEANGAAICLGDPQREQQRTLRRLLHDSDLSLKGAWSCAHLASQSVSWSGTRDQLETDTRLVQSLSRTAVRPLPIELVARTTEPKGEVKGQWTGIDPDALHVVERLDTPDIDSFSLTPSMLAITLEPVTEESRSRTRADIRAHAPSYVRVRVYSASSPKGGPPDADRIRARAAALSLPGVSSARYNGSSHQLVIATPSVDVALNVGELVVGKGFPRTIQAVVTAPPPPGAEKGHVYDTARAPAPHLLTLFRTLVAMPDVVAEVTEAGPARSGTVVVRVTLTRGHVTGSLRQLKSVLPTGTTVNLHAPGDEWVHLVVADRLDAARVTTQGVDKTVFLAAWDAA